MRRSVDTCALGDDGTQHLIGVQATLHEDLRCAFVHQFHRPGCRCVAVCHIDNRTIGQFDPMFIGDGSYAPLRPYERGDDEAIVRSLDSALK